MLEARKEMEKALSSYEGQMFLIYKNSHGTDISELTDKVKQLISEYNLSATAAKGFLEYMKLVIDGCSYIPKKE